MIQALIAIIFFALASLSVFREPLFGNFGSIQWDAVNVHFFNLFFSSEAWNNGVLPLWTPYIFAGFPQAADLQVAFFYPINLFIGTAFVFTPGMVMGQTVLHYFLAGFFTFLLARHLSKNFWFGIAAGLVYSFGGFMVGHASHVGMQNTAAWLPLIFLFLILALEESRTLFAAMSGLFLGIAILAGHFQISIYIVYAFAFYFAFDIAWTLLSRASQKNIEAPIFPVLRKTWLIFVVYLIAFLISAVQLLPTFELTQLSNRAKITLEMSQTESLNPKSLPSLIEPNYNNVAYGLPYSGPWDRTQNYLYIGSTIIILAAMGAFFGIFYRDSRKTAVFWVILLCFSLFFSFGEFGFLQKYFYLFAPFFDKIRAPSNMMLLFNFSVIMLASSLFYNIGKLSRKAEDLPAADKSYSLQNILLVSQKIFFKYASVFLGITALLLISFEILPAVLVPNTLLYSRQKIGEITAAPAIAQKITEEYSQLTEIDKFRTFKIPGLDRNLTQVLHIFAFDGYNPLSLRRHSAYIDAMVKNEKLIDLAAIKYLPCEFIPNRAKDLEKIGDLCINKNYARLAFLIDDHIVADSEISALQKTGEADLKKTLVLEETPESGTKSSNYSKNKPEKEIRELLPIDLKPGSWRLAVRTTSNTFLFINQANYPGWIAEIDGRRTKIYQADYLFQAVFVPKGEHEIILKYKSEPLINGAILTIIGLSSVFFIAIYDLTQRRKIVKKDWQQTLEKIDNK